MVILTTFPAPQNEPLNIAPRLGLKAVPIDFKKLSNVEKNEVAKTQNLINKTQK